MGNFYKEALAKYGEGDIKSLGWSSNDGQYKRFKVFLQEMIPYNKSFLDVGCGFGDFYLYVGSYCKRYVGIDVESEMIDVARKNISDGTFLAADIIDYMADKESFDYVVASGLFSLNRKDWNKNLFKTVKKMFDICRIAVGFNFTKYIENVKNNPEARYTSMGEVVNILDNVGFSSLKMIVGYLPNDFTVIVYK